MALATTTFWGFSLMVLTVATIEAALTSITAPIPQARLRLITLYGKRIDDE